MLRAGCVTVSLLQQCGLVERPGVEIEAHESIKLRLRERHLDEFVDPLLKPSQILSQKGLRLDLSDDHAFFDVGAGRAITHGPNIRGAEVRLEPQALKLFDERKPLWSCFHDGT